MGRQHSGSFGVNVRLKPNLLTSQLSAIQHKDVTAPHPTRTSSNVTVAATATTLAKSGLDLWSR
jgi:hypothetical protein